MHALTFPAAAERRGYSCTRMKIEGRQKKTTGMNNLPLHLLLIMVFT